MITAYYQDDRVAIFHGDARALVSLLPRPDHLISDPPYNEQTHKGARTSKGGGGPRDLIDFSAIDLDDLRDVICRIAPKRWAVFFSAYQHAVALELDPPANMRGVRIGIWDKQNYTPQFTGDRPAQGWEAISMLHNLDAPLRWNGKGKKSVYSFAKVSDGQHPTEKPLKLVSQLIRDFTDPGELILDPFMGSGTTLRAAKDLGRKAIGIELEERYCEIAANRMKQETFAF